MSSGKPSAGVTIIKAGLVAGTLDIMAAIITAWIKGYNPVLIFRYIASAVFGKAAAATGPGMVAIGLGLHYGIALVWTVLFFMAYPFIRRIIKNTVASGLLYGIVVWAIMNGVVVPLSRIPPRPIQWPAALREISILMICIGLPIAIITNQYYHRRSVEKIHP